MKSLLCFCLYLSASAATVLAQDAAAPGAPPLTVSQRLVAMAPMFMIVFFIFYFLVLRPQSKQLRDKESLLASIKKGELVATSGGLIGRVAGIEKDYILLDVANGVKINVERNHVSKRLEKSSEKAEKKAS